MLSNNERPSTKEIDVDFCTLDICTYGKKCLRSKSKDIVSIDESVVELASRMLQIMRTYCGIGLAAPQIGINKRIVVIELEENNAQSCAFDGKTIPADFIFPLVMINPEIVEFSEDRHINTEGCLSLGSVYCYVSRPCEVKVKFLDLYGAEHELSCGDLLSTCVQHEVDHLNGILFIDHVSKKDLRDNKRALDEMRASNRDKQA